MFTAACTALALTHVLEGNVMGECVGKEMQPTSAVGG